MKEFIEKLIGGLEEGIFSFEERLQYDTKTQKHLVSQNKGIKYAIAIVNQLAEEYNDAEEQGLLLRLPCKVGDTVYSVVKDGLQIFELKFSLDFYVRRKDDFGKTIFLTKEEAEQALAEMKEVE